MVLAPLADVTLESKRLPPLLTKSQVFVLENVNTLSGFTGIELTNEIEGKNGKFDVFFLLFTIDIPITDPMSLKTYKTYIIVIV